MTNKGLLKVKNAMTDCFIFTSCLAIMTLCFTTGSAVYVKALEHKQANPNDSSIDPYVSETFDTYEKLDKEKARAIDMHTNLAGTTISTFALSGIGGGATLLLKKKLKNEIAEDVENQN